MFISYVDLNNISNQLLKLNPMVHPSGTPAEISSDDSDDDLIVTANTYTQSTRWYHQKNTLRILFTVMFGLSATVFVVALTGSIVFSAGEVFDQPYQQPADLERHCIKWSCRHELPSLNEIHSCINNHHQRWKHTHEIYKFIRKLGYVLGFKKIYTFNGHRPVIEAVIMYITTLLIIVSLLGLYWIKKTKN